MVRKLVLMK